MKFVVFISERLIRHKKGTYSSNIINIAFLSIALSVAVMLISLSILTGFKHAVKDKIVGFGSHIRIESFGAGADYSDIPVYADKKLVDKLKCAENIKNVTPVLNEYAVVMTEGDFHAVLLKGITDTYDNLFFHQSLVQGRMPELNKESQQEILVSKVVTDQLKLSVGDKIKVYFYVNNNYRSKNFYISGIYDTGLGDHDERFLICDASVLQKIFSLSDNYYSCYEVTVDDFSKLNQTSEYLYQVLPSQMTVRTVTEAEPNLFSWLNLLDSNVIMIIIIMILVTVVTLAGVVLIMIFEKKKMIGIMKSFGTPDRHIIGIFIAEAGWIMCKGLLFGNILALVLEAVQKYTDVIKLDAKGYYLTSVPVDINFVNIILMDVGILFICTLFMVIPAKIISKMSVVKNLRFE